MALTYTVVVTQDTSGGETGAQEVAGLSAGTLVAAYLDGEERGRTFIPRRIPPQRPSVVAAETSRRPALPPHPYSLPSCLHLSSTTRRATRPAR